MYSCGSDHFFLSDYFEKRKNFFFVGSAIVTQNEAALWTDGRYFIQAAAQLDSNWTLMKDGTFFFRCKNISKGSIRVSQFFFPDPSDQLVNCLPGAVNILPNKKEIHESLA